MSLSLDLILIAAFVFTCIAGVKKGLIQSLIDFLGSIISVVLAYFFSNPIATAIYKNFVEEGLYKRVHDAALKSTPNELMENIYMPLPNFIKSLLEEQGITESTLVTNAYGTADKVATAVTAALSPVFILLIKFFVIIILFLLFMVIIRLVGNLLKPVLKIPGIAQVNGILGGVFGFFFCFMIVWIVLALLSFGMHFLNAENLATLQAFVGNSILFKYFVTLNPMSWIIS